jgi:large subunit ribosomal protein L31e
MEKTYTIPLRHAFAGTRSQRSNVAIKVVKEYLKNKLKIEDARVDPSLSAALWSKSIRSPPRSVKVAIKEEDGKKTAVLAE